MESSEEDRKMRENLELSRHVLNCYDQNAGIDMVSDENEKLNGNWSERHFCFLAKKLAALCHCLRDL